ncbi:MAG: hypothetical protein FJ297_15910, partial [Planctomycetes bacterium]|nr:hypothetical protein [Planctomycetota bacterium]
MRIPPVNRLGARRRGVVLLVVLTLLSLFVVIGTTFLLVASHYMRGAQSQARVGMYGDPPQKLLDTALYQVVRGTRDPNSNIGTNDLLADLYGLDGFIAYAGIVNVAGNTMTLHVPVPEVIPNQGYPYSAPPSQSVGDFVFWRTITDRRTAYFPQTLPTDDSGRPPNTPTHQAPWMFGYYMGQHLTFINVLPNPAIPAVVPPHGLRNNTVPITSYARRISASPPTAPFPFSDLPLDSNGQYEYAEIRVTWPNNAYQAPSLNAIAGNAANAVVTILVNGRPYNGLPNNVAYPDESYDAVDDSNLYLADPIDLTQPSFRGLGPPEVNLNPASVDTDGDGTRDARWIDIGLPLQTGRNGRQVRPLVAVRCVDLDGRINVNFHGSGSHLTTPATWTILDSGGTPRYRPSRGNASTDPQYSNTFSIASRGQGSGVGPADVTLFDVLAQAAHDAMPALANNVKEGAAATWYAQLLAMRYGTGATPGIVGDDAATVGSPSELKFRNYLASSSFIDFHSALRYGMDPRGMPALEPPYHPSPLIDSPYELRADAMRGYAPGANDTLFGLAELERLLRASDWDANAIPSRLLNPVLYDIDGDGNLDPLMLGAMPSFRNSITTESWDLGLLKIQKEVNKGGPALEPTNAFVELVEPFLPNNLTPDQMRALMERLVTERTLPPEVVYGMPLDLNRPLTQLNLANPNAYTDRQLLARQLYVLMLVVGNVTDPAEYARIAQWAINVVDFRDQDSVMTPFEYDTNPFNGWDVDQDLTTTNETAERAVVWGCERPELLITEAFAWHDVRVNRSGTTWQQPYRPRGAAFVELYNPWATSSHGSDLNPWGVNFSSGVAITRTAPGGAPVWRLEFLRGSETRYAYFTSPVGSNAPMPPEGTYFSNTTSNPLFIMPGQYGVVGSVGWPIDPNSVGFNSDIDNDGQNDFVNPLGLPVGAVVPPEPDYLTSRRVQMSFGPNGQTYLT